MVDTDADRLRWGVLPRILVAPESTAVTGYMLCEFVCHGVGAEDQ